MACAYGDHPAIGDAERNVLLGRRRALWIAKKLDHKQRHNPERPGPGQTGPELRQERAYKTDGDKKPALTGNDRVEFARSLRSLIHSGLSCVARRYAV